MVTDYKIAVIGFGYIGSVIGATLSSKGIDVVGFEKNEYIIECIENGVAPFVEESLEEKIKIAKEKGCLIVSNHSDILKDRNVFIITVGTPMSDNFKADLTDLESVCKLIKPYVSEESLVIVKSTVPPFTTKNIVYEILKEKCRNITFCPERLAEGKAIAEFESIPIVVGGIDESSGLSAKKFWEDVLDVETILVKDCTAAEMVKLADNLWIDLNISLAHELSFLCDKMGTDVLDVIKAANTLPKGYSNVNILTPSVGVGGYCLTKDPWFVNQLGKDYDLALKLPTASRTINDEVPIYSANMVDQLLLEKFGSDKKTIKVAVLGIAFKNDTGDCRYSPTKSFIDRIIEIGYKVDICDPLVLPHDAKLITNIELSKNIFDTVKDSHCIAFLTGHQIFKELSLKELAGKANPGALIFDGRRYFEKDEIQEIKNLGMNYKGVGR